jgi:hypothetical protein
MKIRLFIFISFVFITAQADLAVASGKAAPKDAELYIISPQDGASVSSPVTVVFGLKGMGVAPAGIFKENTGHHHLLIDVEKLPELKSPIPNDEQHQHFGGGQTQVTIDLKPGKHSLQLLLGDLVHIPHSPPLISKKIHITVK